jgi:hypothetical protein
MWGCRYSLFGSDRISNFLSRQVSDIPRGIWNSSPLPLASINSCFRRQMFECNALSSGRVDENLEDCKWYDANLGLQLYVNEIFT